MPMNWCPQCKIVVANEEVVNATHERCGGPVESKNLRQWLLRITKYADRLIDDLEGLDWPEPIKLMQKNWVGKSHGINFKHKVKDIDIEFEVYDSIPQTFHAQTFVIIAPEHPLVEELVKGTDKEKEVMEFVEKIKKSGCKVKNIALISGYWTKEAILKAKEIDCTVFHKPLQLAQLHEWLDNCEKNIGLDRILSQSMPCQLSV